MDTNELDRLEALMARNEVGPHKVDIGTGDILALFRAAPSLIADARALAAAKARIAELENSLDWFADENGDGAQREAYRLLNP